MEDNEDDFEVTRIAPRDVLARVIEAQASTAQPYIVVVTSRTSAGKAFRLAGGLVIGRAADADIRLDEEGVSRRHARVSVNADGTVELQDLGSRNGTYLNGTPVSHVALHDGDRIQIGAVSILKVDYQNAAEEMLQRNLYESATRDPLTGAANRGALEEALRREMGFSRRHARPLSVIMLDVDHFKRVNDTYGHAAGDAVLRSLAQLVRRELRREDLLARYGGEEFSVILRDIDVSGATACAERIRAAVEAHDFEFAGARIPVTISAGVACSLEDGDVMSAADGRLYQAKRGGRNRVCGKPAAAHDGSRSRAGCLTANR